MRVDYQNLQDDDQPRRFWTHGRIWVRFRREWYAARRCGQLEIEWCVPCSHCGWGITFGGGDAGRDLGLTLAVPLVVTLHATLSNVFRLYAFGTDVDRGSDREIACSFHDGAFWYRIWVGSFASWSRGYPWCRWWRQGSIYFANVLGKQHYTCVPLVRDLPVAIPMPEGVYRAVATIQRQTWKRRLWFARSRVSVDVRIPKGIPFAGKGENSWDCGDDGLFGYSVDGTSPEKAIAHGIEVVLTNRRRYGMPSAAAIAAAGPEGRGG